MVIVMKANATEEQISGVEKFLSNLELGVYIYRFRKDYHWVIGDKRIPNRYPLR